MYRIKVLGLEGMKAGRAWLEERVLGSPPWRKRPRKHDGKKMQTRWIVLAGLLATLAVSPARAAEDGLVTRPSKYTVAETADRLEAGLRQAGATVFARIDYAQSAHDAGLALNPTVLILFGNPKAGTPLMAQ